MELACGWNTGLIIPGSRVLIQPLLLALLGIKLCYMALLSRMRPNLSTTL
jgi:hypothetical protein